MKAMIWKELRENFKWALLAMFGLGMAEFYALNQQSFFNSYIDVSQSLCKAPFLMATTFGCALVGLVLGFVQILPEQRRDQWAALLHRPVPRNVIFRGKAVAGFLLYLFATIPPYLACVWYVDTPRHFAAPFVPGMVAPGLADICAGAAYYFAALFVGLRRGPWYGSRIFGLLAAVYVSSFVTDGYQASFSTAVAASALMALTLFVAAWGAMSSNGLLRVQPWLGRAALLAVVFYGVCAASQLFNSILESVTPYDYYEGAEYIVDIDGRPLKQVVTKDSPATYFDLAGNPVLDERLTKGNSYRYQLGFTYLTSYIGDPHGLHIGGFSEGYRTAGTYLWLDRQVQQESWYYLPDSRVFIGYKNGSRTRIGSIGQDGFQPGDQSARPFNDGITVGPGFYSGQIPSFVLLGQTVCHLDFDDRRITPILSSPDDKIFGVSTLESYQQDELISGLAAVALLPEIKIIDKTGNVFATLPYHQDMDHYGRLTVAVKPTKDRVFLKYAPSAWIDGGQAENMPSYLEEMDTQGNLLNTYTLPPIHQPGSPRTWSEYIDNCLRTPVLYFGHLAYVRIGALLGSESLALENRLLYTRDWHHTRDISVHSTISSLIFSIVTLLWARRLLFSWQRALAWAAFVLGFNLAGLITFRLVADWPVLVNCLACGRKRSIEETLCPHCAAGWPARKPEGTEIVDSIPLTP
jgi:hypothetical protein